MRPTNLENKVLRKKTPTEEIIEDFGEEEVTAVGDILEIKLDFTLGEKDIWMIQSIADEQCISYETAMYAVFRDALDLYHWQRRRMV